jgi:hypothetical protein
MAARLQDQPLAGGGTRKVKANPVLGCDSFKQKQVTVKSAEEHKLLRELRRHQGLLQPTWLREKGIN